MTEETTKVNIFGAVDLLTRIMHLPETLDACVWDNLVSARRDLSRVIARAAADLVKSMPVESGDGQ